ncbi:MAG: hypothetical protein AAFV45_15640 [Pseudomonadota bacterium]
MLSNNAGNPSVRAASGVLPKASKEDGPKTDGSDAAAGDMRIHPIVTRLVEPVLPKASKQNALEKMGAQPIKAG